MDSGGSHVKLGSEPKFSVGRQARHSACRWRENLFLCWAAVIGREFDFPLLRAALPNAGEKALLQAIDDGLQALVIEPLPSRGEEWYQFRHALIRDALYESISPSRRARWHATITQALETLLGDTVEDRAAVLAQHAACAGGLIEPAMLGKYSCIAGERLLVVHAFEEALAHFERAWRARVALPFDAVSAATVVGLGLAQAATAARWNRAGMDHAAPRPRVCAHGDRALALSAHQLPFLHTRVLLEYETRNRKTGDWYQRLLAAERLAGPFPLAGTFAALALSQTTQLWNESTPCLPPCERHALYWRDDRQSRWQGHWRGSAAGSCQSAERGLTSARRNSSPWSHSRG